jgi:hypothetical protein
MNSHKAVRILGLALLLAAAGGVAGCSSCKPGKSNGAAQSYNLKITPGESLKDSSVVVDVVGINPSELQKWQSYSLKKYLKPGDALRQDAAKTTANFLPGQQTPFVIKKTDPIWDQWLKSGAQYLVVIADLPGVFEEGKAGTQDPRRHLIPLCKCYWPGGVKELEAKVQAGGVSLVTGPREGWSLPAW